MAHRKLFQPRFNRAVRFALAANLAAIAYALPLLSIAVNQQARNRIDRISPRARRVLAFLAALHRAGKAGFLGVEVTYGALSAAIRRTTGERCGVSTLKLAIGELKAAGYLAVEWGTELTELDDSGNWRPRAREIAPGEYIALRVRILMLTERAISLWSKPRKTSNGGANSLSQKVTADVSPKQCFKTLVPCKHTSDHIEAPISEASNPDKKEPASRSATGQPSGQSSSSDGLRVVGRGGSKQRPDATRQQGKGFKANFGPSSQRPKTPGRAAGKTWSHNRARLLAAIWSVLASYPRREADLLFSRATQETDRHWPRHWPACLPWQYWIQRWADLAPGEQRRTLKHIVFPALKNYVVKGTTSPAARVPTKQTRLGGDNSSPLSNSTANRGQNRKQQEKLVGWLQAAVEKLKDNGIL